MMMQQGSCHKPLAGQQNGYKLEVVPGHCRLIDSFEWAKLVGHLFEAAGRCESLELSGSGALDGRQAAGTSRRCLQGFRRVLRAV